MSSHRFIVAMSTLVFVIQLTSGAFATTITQLTSAKQLSSNDTAFVDKDAPGTVYAGPSVSFNNGNNRLTFSRSSGGFETDKVGFNYGASAFTDGSVLVGAGGFQGPGDGGVITLTFAVPVIQFGMNIEDFDLSGSGSGAYGLRFTAYNPAGTLLGSYLAIGCNDNSCLSFEGLTVVGDSVGSLRFAATSPLSENNLMFGNIAYAPAGTALQAPSPVPEPSSIALLGTGLLGLAAFGRRAKDFFRHPYAR